MPNDVPDWTVAAAPQPRNLPSVVAGQGASATVVSTLPQGTQSVGFYTQQTAGSGMGGNAVLTLSDGSGNQYEVQSPVLLNIWGATFVSALPDDQLTAKLDCTGITGTGVQFTTAMVALPYSAVVGAMTFPGASVALKASLGNLVMATADNIQVYGSVTNPAANAVIAGTSPVPFGHYKCRVRCGYGLTADTIEDNFKLVLNTVEQYTQLRAPAQANGLGVERVLEYLFVPSSHEIQVQAILAHVAAGAVYWATIDLTPFTIV